MIQEFHTSKTNNMANGVKEKRNVNYYASQKDIHIQKHLKF